MKVADFIFSLPEELIAKRPVKRRDNSRLLVLHKDGRIEHRKFNNLSEYLNKGDMLLLNKTKVFPARLTGTKPTGGKVEFLLVREKAPDTWEILSKKKWNGRLSISDHFSAEMKDGKFAYFSYEGNFMENLWRHGDMPLPPYIKRSPEQKDKEWYQTTYAEKQGSIAAPTAGLHFTPELIREIKDNAVNVRYLTLHVGIGTFRPIKAENVEEHSMDSEYFEIETSLISEIKNIKASGRKVVAVGTTTTRAIEGFISGRWQEIEDEKMRRWEDKNSELRTLSSERIIGYTNIFIYPGYDFKVVDSLITNFHLPRSTPLMLTSALCGQKKLKKAYEAAIADRYRFFSYGDAMLIL